MQLTRLVPIALASFIGATVSPLFADETTDLIKSLQERNAVLERRVRSLEEQLDQRLTAIEGQLGQKSKVVEPKAPVAATVKAVDAEPSKFKPDDWITGIRIFSDLRMRYDEVFAPDAAFVTRWRIRPRLRLGSIVTLKDSWEIGLRIASAPSVAKDTGGDQLSTNQTFEDNGSRKPVGVDWAFARWTPIRTPTATGSFALGKLENPPNYTEDVFDVDYTPEGFAEQFSFVLSPKHTASAYLGQYVLDEQQFSTRDSLLFVEQLRLESKLNKQVSTALTVSGLTISKPDGLTSANVPDSNHGNTRTAAGVLVNDYRLLVLDGGVTFMVDNFPLAHGPFPIRLAAEYIHNYGASDNNTAYAFGPAFGRVSQTGRVKKGDWEFSYRYQELQGDSNYEELTASDNGIFSRGRPIAEPGTGTFRPTFLNGLNLRGHAFRLAIAPNDSLVIDSRVWVNESIRPDATGDRTKGVRLLFDLVWKL